MKKLLVISTAAIGLFALVGPAKAQTTVTSIQFVNSAGYANNSPLSSTEVAGVNAVDNWNISNTSQFYVYQGSSPLTNSASSGTLATSTGGISPVAYNISSAGGAYYPGNDVTSTPGNTALMQGGAVTIGANTSSLYAGDAVLTLSSLTAGDTYSFYVYLGGPQYDLTEGSVTDAALGTTYYYVSPNGGFAATPITDLEDNASLTDFGPSLSTSPGTASSLYHTNYVEFTGITGVTSDTISVASLGSWPNGALLTGTANAQAMTISGVQVIDTAGSVPEPATIWTAALGLLGLVGFQRRRLFARS